MSPTNDLGQGSALRQVRSVIERLVRESTAVARSDGTLHSLFPVAASAVEGEALREWVLRERAVKPWWWSALGTKVRGGVSSARMEG